MYVGLLKVKQKVANVRALGSKGLLLQLELLVAPLSDATIHIARSKIGRRKLLTRASRFIIDQKKPRAILCPWNSYTKINFYLIN